MHVAEASVAGVTGAPPAAYDSALKYVPLGINTPADDFNWFHDATATGNNIWYQFQATRFGDLSAGAALIEILKDRSAALQVEIDAYRHRASLLNPRHLDPDIVVERARAMLNMAHADDVLVMVNPENGKPISGQFEELIDSQLISIIEADSTL